VDGHWRAEAQILLRHKFSKINGSYWGAARIASHEAFSG
jgi:hypothetical protein